MKISFEIAENFIAFFVILICNDPPFIRCQVAMRFDEEITIKWFIKDEDKTSSSNQMGVDLLPYPSLPVHVGW